MSISTKAKVFTVVALVLGMLVGSFLLSLTQTPSSYGGVRVALVTPPRLMYGSGFRIEEVVGTYGIWPFRVMGAELVVNLTNRTVVTEVPKLMGPEDIANFEDVVDELHLRGEHITYLLKYGFFTSPTRTANPLTIYRLADRAGLPTYVSIDALIYTYLLLLNSIVGGVEERYLATWLKQVLEGIYHRLLDYGTSNGFSSDVKKAITYVAVPLYLYYSTNGGNPSLGSELPNDVMETVRGEVNLILRHDKWYVSPFLGYEVDYTLFKVRGHYTRSNTLANYFRAVVWLGTMRLCGDVGTALLISLALKSSPTLWDLWERLNAVVTFLVGNPKDLTPADVVNELNLSGGLPLLLNPPEAWVSKLREVFKGMCFSLLPQRGTYDAMIFSRLTHDEVWGRYLPRGLDIAASLGYDHALKYLTSDVKAYEGYESKLWGLRNYLGNLSSEEWYGNVHHSILYVIRGAYSEAEVPLIAGVLTINEELWLDRLLSSTLGSWSISRHHVIPYVTQLSTVADVRTSSTLMVTATTTPLPTTVTGRVKPHQGVVDPLPTSWSRLVILVNATVNGFKTLGVVSDEDLAKLNELLKLLTALRDIAVKELRGEVSACDLSIINELTPKLYKILSGTPITYVRPEDPDVFTSPYTKEVLFAEVGFLDLAVITYRAEDGRVYAAVGCILTYYEFTGRDRLTDEEWFNMLLEGKELGIPTWVGSYRAKAPIYQQP